MDARGRDLTGRQLGAYRLEAPLADGAFGRVYRARHVVLDIPRAVKVMQTDIAGDPKYRDRFLREARTAAQLHHPNIVAVYDFGAEDQIQYLVMEYVDSTTLAERLSRLPVPGRVARPQVRQWVRDVAGGLDHAHGFGIVHRDLKPGNVLVRTEDGRAMLTDFGIAQAPGDPRLTVPGRSLGTYAYMAPEQREGASELTSATDVYAFAALLYEIATGQPPFGRELWAAAGRPEKPLPPLRLTAPGLPSELDDVLAKGLAKSPKDRPLSAGELAEAWLAAVVGGADDGASGAADQMVPVAPGPVWNPPSAPVVIAETVTPPPRRLRLPVPSPRLAAAAAAVLVGGAAVAVLVWALTRPPAPVPHPTPPGLPGAASLPAPVRGAVGAPVHVAGMQVTVLGANASARPPASLRLAADQRLLTVRVEYRAGGATTFASPYDWVVSDASGTLYGPTVSGIGGALSERELRPGQTARGQIGFVVPRAAQGLVLRFDAEVGDDTAQVPLG